MKYRSFLLLFPVVVFVFCGCFSGERFSADEKLSMEGETCSASGDCQGQLRCINFVCTHNGIQGCVNAVKKILELLVSENPNMQKLGSNTPDLFQSCRGNVPHIDFECISSSASIDQVMECEGIKELKINNDHVFSRYLAAKRIDEAISRLGKIRYAQLKYYDDDLYGDGKFAASLVDLGWLLPDGATNGEPPCNYHYGTNYQIAWAEANDLAGSCKPDYMEINLESGKLSKSDNGGDPVASCVQHCVRTGYRSREFCQQSCRWVD
jgi:hypothetical protein